MSIDELRINISHLEAEKRALDEQQLLFADDEQRGIHEDRKLHLERALRRARAKLLWHAAAERVGE